MEEERPSLHVLFQAISDKTLKQNFFDMCLVSFNEGVYSSEDVLMCGFTIMPPEFATIMQANAAWFLSNHTDVWGKPKDEVLCKLKGLILNGSLPENGATAVRYIRTVYSNDVIHGMGPLIAMYLLKKPYLDSIMGHMRARSKLLIETCRCAIMETYVVGGEEERVRADEACLRLFCDHYHRCVLDQVNWSPKPDILTNLLIEDVEWQAGVRGPNDDGGWVPHNYIEICREV
jgi:hypothetical protein